MFIHIVLQLFFKKKKVKVGQNVKLITFSRAAIDFSPQHFSLNNAKYLSHKMTMHNVLYLPLKFHKNQTRNENCITF